MTKSNDGPSAPPKPDKSSTSSKRIEGCQTTHDPSQLLGKDKASAPHSEPTKDHHKTNIIRATRHDGCETNQSRWTHPPAPAPHLTGSTDVQPEPTSPKLKDLLSN